MASRQYTETPAADGGSEDYSSEEDVKGKGKASKDPNKPVKRRSSKACESATPLLSYRTTFLPSTRPRASFAGLEAAWPRSRMALTLFAGTARLQVTSESIYSLHPLLPVALADLHIFRPTQSCRKSKCKCTRILDPGTGQPVGPCSNCITVGAECTYLGASRKRGPPKG